MVKVLVLFRCLGWWICWMLLWVSVIYKFLFWLNMKLLIWVLLMVGLMMGVMVQLCGLYWLIDVCFLLVIQILLLGVLIIWCMELRVLFMWINCFVWGGSMQMFVVVVIQSVLLWLVSIDYMCVCDMFYEVLIFIYFVFLCRVRLFVVLVQIWFWLFLVRVYMMDGGICVFLNICRWLCVRYFSFDGWNVIYSLFLWVVVSVYILNEGSDWFGGGCSVLK